MNTYQRYMQYRKDELYHYNKNHDPKDGRFTSSRFGYGNVTVTAYSKRPLTSAVKRRTADDNKMISEIQNWDNNERKHLLRSNTLTNNVRIAAFKFRRTFDKVEAKSGLPVMDTKETKEDALRKINPSKKTTLASSGNNCCLCTVAYDMRRRGYDVIANQNPPIDLVYDIGAEDVSMMYKGFPKEVKTKTAAGLEKALSKQPDGARGAAFCSWNGGSGGHVVAYEVEKGKATLYDCQTGKRYEKPSDLFNDVSDTSYIRLDDKEPNYDYVKMALQ